MSESQFFLRLRSLRTQREALKSHLKSFHAFLISYDKIYDFEELESRAENLNTYLKKIDYLCDEIQMLDESDLNNDERSMLLNLYYRITGLAKKYLAENNVSLNSNYSSASKSINNESNGKVKNKIKLKHADIPRFYGDIEKWLSFKNLFTALVHNNEDLSEIEKLNQLQYNLGGDALKKIKILHVSDETYNSAWNILLKTYHNERILISRHLSLLLNMPQQEKDSTKGLSNLIDESNQHLQALKSLGVNISSEIVVQIVEEKMNKYTRSKWIESIDSNVFPTVEKLSDFVTKQTNSSLSKRVHEKTHVNSHRDEGPSSSKRRKISHNRDSDRSAKTLAAKTAIRSNSKCPACLTDNHPLFKCKKFRELAVYKRIQLVKQEPRLCGNCLNYHGDKPCTYGLCRHCDKNHNTLLHIPKENEKVNSKPDKNNS